MGRLTPFLDDILLGAALLILVGMLAPALLPWAVLGAALWFAGKLWIFRAHLRGPAVGVEAMPGRVAVALRDLAPRGQVDLDGEIWAAEASEPVGAGERVRVEAVEGLTLRVAPLGVAGGPAPRRPPRSMVLDLARRLRPRG